MICDEIHVYSIKRGPVLVSVAGGHVRSWDEPSSQFTALLALFCYFMSVQCLVSWPRCWPSATWLILMKRSTEKQVSQNPLLVCQTGRLLMLTAGCFVVLFLILASHCVFGLQRLRTCWRILWTAHSGWMTLRPARSCSRYPESSRRSTAHKAHLRLIH